MRPRTAFARTRAQLFPAARSDAPLTLVAPPDIAWSPRKWSFIVAMGFLPLGLMILDMFISMPVLRLLVWAFGEDDGARYYFYVLGASIVLAGAFTVAWLVLAAVHSWRIEEGPRVSWSSWSASRGLEPASPDLLDEIDAPLMTFVPEDRRWGYIHAWQQIRLFRIRAARTIPHLYRGELGASARDALVGCGRWVRVIPSEGSVATPNIVVGRFVALRLSPDVGAAFPACRLVRMVRSPGAPAQQGAEGFDSYASGSKQLTFESTDLHETARIEVVDGDEISWRRLFDTTLVAALAHDLDVEFQQWNDWLVVASRAGAWRRSTVREGRMDTMCAAAELLARRFEMEARAILRDRPELAPEPARPEARTTRYLDHQRARDLDLPPEALFFELARYTSAAEVESVRAKVDSGEFPLEWLDDLVHHRRAAFWGADEMGDSDSRAA